MPAPATRIALPQPPLELAVGEPVQFPIVYSSTRLADRPGELIEITEEQFTHLLPISHRFAGSRSQTIRAVAGCARNGAERVWDITALVRYGRRQPTVATRV